MTSANLSAHTQGDQRVGVRAELARLSKVLPPGRKRLWGMLALLVIRSAFELVGVGAVAPFLKVATDPTVIQEVDALAWLYRVGGFTSPMAFTTALGVCVVVSLALGNVLAVVAARQSTAYSWDVVLYLSRRLLRGYLARPYAYHTTVHSAQVHRTVMQESQQVGAGVVGPLLTLAGQSLVVVAVVALLLASDLVVSSILLTVIGGVFAITHAAAKKRTAASGEERLRANRVRNKVASEALSGIRELKVLQQEELPLARFRESDSTIRRGAVLANTLPLVPRYLVEVLLVGSMIVALLVVRSGGQAPASLLPTLSLYLFAGIRLLPAMQNVFGAITAYRTNRSTIDEVLAALEDGAEAQQHEQEPLEALPFGREVVVRDLCFRYEGQQRPALDGVSFRIPRGSSLGVIGSSGSGKSTLADILLGLQWPERGAVCVDGQPLGLHNIRAWRPQVGYVSQAVFITDESLLANIAFGEPPETVDRARALEVARLAQLQELLNTLPQGLDTVVGERGVRLSGGQRQRIGVARALYRHPPLLILDEATSALDGVTEQLVMADIQRQRQDQTLMVIAHRLATIRHCDQILLLNEGRVAEIGSWEELEQRSALFRQLATAAAMSGAPQSSNEPIGSEVTS
ncbi:ABC transporter ATP-binding protein [Gemmatimonas sp.]|uniref:ABC transporter ATP-binding protein n=1 Tax=Gemmatimonas sp. TaxID=1962908 RepID=UPI00391999DD